MLDFCDAPYRFFPARPSPVLMGICRQVNRAVILPGPRHRVRDVDLEGDVSGCLGAKRAGGRLLFVANHATHSDPQVLTEVLRRLGTPSCFMGAYDVFLRGSFQAWMMQRNGVFSVDRDGADRKAMVAAVDVLKGGAYALSIFPEGNVYLTNDRVEPFLDGAAFIALKAQKELGAALPVHVVPVALKFTHLTDVREKVRERLDRIAGAVGLAVDRDAPPDAEIMRIGRALLLRHLRQRGYLKPGEELDAPGLFDAVTAAAGRIVTGLEAKMDLAAKPSDSLIDRLRRIRTTIHQLRTDPAREVDHRPAAAWADEAILAIRILGYGRPYVTEHPSLDRVAETVEKLGEDLYSRWERPLGERRVVAHLGTTIPVGDFLERFAAKPRIAVTDLTARMEAAVQGGLDAANAGNSSEGAGRF